MGIPILGWTKFKVRYRYVICNILVCNDGTRKFIYMLLLGQRYLINKFNKLLTDY